MDHQSVVCAVGVPLVPPVAVLGRRPISLAAYARMTLCHAMRTVPQIPTEKQQTPVRPCAVHANVTELRSAARPVAWRAAAAIEWGDLTYEARQRGVCSSVSLHPDLKGAHEGEHGGAAGDVFAAPQQALLDDGEELAGGLEHPRACKADGEFGLRSARAAALLLRRTPLSSMAQHVD